MRTALALVAVAVLAASCGSEPAARPQGATPTSSGTTSTETAAGRYGLTIDVPAGWDAAITRGAVRFANRPLPELALCGGPRELDPGDLVVDVLERDPQPGELSYFPALDRPPRLAVGDFRPPEPGTFPDTHTYANVPFSLDGRYFVIFGEAGARSAASAVVDEANAALATLAVEPGDFYPGDVEPASFAPADDWQAGSSGPQPVHSDGDWAVSWAATVPYRDEWDALPRTTLESLPPDGIVIWLWLTRSCDPGGTRQQRPVRPRPYRLADFEVHSGWEGQVRDVPEYMLWTRVGGQYDVDLRVYFGSQDPTDEMLVRAQKELDRLELPDWGRWELG